MDLGAGQGRTVNDKKCADGTLKTADRPPMKSAISCILSFAFCVTTAHAQRFDYEEAPHNYWSVPMEDSCTVLDKAMASGAIKLSLADGKGLVKAVLEALKVPVESQVLVFSKTSLQKDPDPAFRQCRWML